LSWGLPGNEDFPSGEVFYVAEEVAQGVLAGPGLLTVPFPRVEPAAVVLGDVVVGFQLQGVGGVEAGGS
jgi:hypothetical protein